MFSKKEIVGLAVMSALIFSALMFYSYVNELKAGIR